MCVCFRDVSLSGRKPPVWSQTSSVFLQSRKPRSGTGEKAQHSATYVHTQTHTAHTRIMFTALIWHYNAAVCVCVQVQQQHRSSSLCLHVPHHHLRSQRSRLGPVRTWSWPPTPLSCTLLLNYPTTGLISATVPHAPFVSEHRWI